MHAQKTYPKIKIHSMENFSASEKERVKEEMALLETKVLQNEAFWERIKTCVYQCTDRRILQSERNKDCPYARLPRDGHHYTSQEVHDLLFYGDDEIGLPKDGILDLKLRIKKRNKKGSSKGSTSGCVLKISSYRSKTIRQQKGVYAAHILHEYMHVLGFSHHDQNARKNRKICEGYDIPYAVGKIAREFLGLKVVNQRFLCVK